MQYFIKFIVPFIAAKGAAWADTKDRLEKVQSNMSLTRKVLRFGKHKGMHVTKIPQGYLDWACENMGGKWQLMFKKEKTRREDSQHKKLMAMNVPF